MKRRDFLRGAAVLAAGAGGGAATLLGEKEAAAFGETPKGAEASAVPASLRAQNILEIFLYGGVSQYESFYCVDAFGQSDGSGWWTFFNDDILQGLTAHFVASHFSLETLILDILAHPAFNLKAPDEGCGVAYELPNIFDPWTTSDGDLARRGNSPADGVFAISARPLVRSLHRAMEWPARSEFPGDDDETSFQSAVGLFLKEAEPGYRGLDFQGRLTWEATYAGCPNLSGNDFISKIVTRSAVVPGATVADGIIALKDRLTGEPTIEPSAEKPALEALLGGSLASTDLGGLDAKLRTVCGVLVSTPQLMLGGIPPRDTRDMPRLTPPDVTYQGTCGYLSDHLAGTGTPYVVACGAASLTVTQK